MSARDRDKPSILVMGEALVDVVTRGADVDEHVGGSPANVAFGLGRLGHDVALATWIGADRRGKRIARTCRRAGVELVPGSDKAPRTSVANAEIDPQGHATYLGVGKLGGDGRRNSVVV
jgi:fructokinase